MFDRYDMCNEVKVSDLFKYETDAQPVLVCSCLGELLTTSTPPHKFGHKPCGYRQILSPNFLAVILVTRFCTPSPLIYIFPFLGDKCNGSSSGVKVQEKFYITVFLILLLIIFKIR